MLAAINSSLAISHWEVYGISPAIDRTGLENSYSMRTHKPTRAACYYWTGINYTDVRRGRNREPTSWARRDVMHGDLSDAADARR